MVTQNIINNVLHIEAEIAWIEQIITRRLASDFSNDTISPGTFEKTNPDILLNNPSPNGHVSHYSSLIKELNLSTEERILLVMALLPHLKPDLLDKMLIRNPATNKIYTCLGGVQTKSGRTFLPTFETFLYVLCGKDMARRFFYMNIFNDAHWFFEHNILIHEPVKGEPAGNSVIRISPEILVWCTNGTRYKPAFNSEFPAKEISTSFSWDDLVLDSNTKAHIKDLLNWIQYKDALYEKYMLGYKLKQGYKALFHGPPGTGKTLAASLIGKETSRPVYRIDLSQVVSKYIGETEKNLSRIFEKAQNGEWILFFDEADALFGSRTKTESSNDRYANQEVSYLLQRIEDFPGMVILASNFKSNIDAAFVRRFNSIIYFPLPKEGERLLLWQKAFPETARFDPEIDFNQLAKVYNLTGANIMNIAGTTLIQQMADATSTITAANLRKAINNELRKEGKTS